MFTRATITWNMRQYTKMMKDGKVTFDNAIQRGKVWTKSQKSLLVHSIVSGYPIPPLYARRVIEDDKKTYDMLDGQQRSFAVYEYMENQYALENVPEIELESGESIDINGKYFRQLDEDLQDEIKSATFVINYFDDMNEDEVAEMFYRLNNGKPLSAIVMTRCKAKSLSQIRELGQHQLFKSILTAKAFERYTNEDIVIKSYIMMSANKEDLCLDTKYVRNVMQNVEFTESDIDKLNKIFDYILRSYNGMENRKIAKKLVTRTHMLSVIPVVCRAIEASLPTMKFAEWFENFFSPLNKGEVTRSAEYNANVTNGANHHVAVVARCDAMMDAFKEFCGDSLKDHKSALVSYFESVNRGSGIEVETESEDCEGENDSQPEETTQPSYRNGTRDRLMAAIGA